MNTVNILPKKKANKLIAQLDDRIYYYLNDDYNSYLELKILFGSNIQIRSLSGMFDSTLQEIKNPFIELIANLNNKYNSFSWWGCEIASMNSESTPLLKNITYLFCAKKILALVPENVGFIVDGYALSEIISKLSVKMGFQVRNYQKAAGIYKILERRFFFVIHILRFLLEAAERRKAAFKCIDSLPSKKCHSSKRVILRSWFTENTLSDIGVYKDRNFGPLPDWLTARSYEIWVLPMLFNLSSSFETVFTFMQQQKQKFIIPEHYLKISDYIGLVYSHFKSHRIKINNAQIEGIDLSSLFNEVLEKNMFSLPLTLNLCNSMLKRLKENNYEIDGFYYPFENNMPEKQFILSCKKYYRNSKIIAFQHTTFFPNQLAYHLGSGEAEFHPLPDKIVCSGPIYLGLLERSGFPKKILKSGPNLRFGAVHELDRIARIKLNNSKKSLMLPLTFSYNLAYELILKIQKCIEDSDDYQVYIRNHPLLNKIKLKSFLENIGLTNYYFADDGIIQEWLPSMNAMILTGGSITTLEAVVMGVPVIRIVPDNTISYDCFAGSEYPLYPVNSAEGIKKQLQIVESLLDDDRDTFSKIAKKVLPNYFSKPTDINLKHFL